MPSDGAWATSGEGGETIPGGDCCVVFDKTVFRPDITVMVDWALKSNNQSIGQ